MITEIKVESNPNKLNQYILHFAFYIIQIKIHSIIYQRAYEILKLSEEIKNKTKLDETK